MAYAVEMLNITKTFPGGVKANDSVTLKVKKGEIHALVGENGAGKTTLMSILYGLLTPDEGVIKIDGKEVKITSPRDAIALGIGMVHQKFQLVPSFTILENICLGVEPVRSKCFIDSRRTLKSVIELSEKYGLKIDPRMRIQNCPVAIQQRVEILKALYRNADILILDEPTSVLTPQETDALFGMLRTFVDKGKTIIFITHKLKEVMEISDNVTVMRKGKVVGSKLTSETNLQELARMMVGREVLLRVDKRPANPGNEPILEVKDLVVTDDRGLVAVNKVSFDVKPGEIFGIAGVQGNGQTELVEALTGLRKVEIGQVKLKGKDITNLTPLKRREAGMSYIPEDRISCGLNLSASIEENLIATSYSKAPFARYGIFNFDERAKYAEKLVKEFDIRTPSREVLVRALSGGNMQKIIAAREMSADKSLLVASQPTRGLDVGSIEFIHRRLVDARDRGIAVLLVSTELDEILSLCDRIAVMYEGRIVDIVPTRIVTEEELGLLMAGIVPESLIAKKRGDLLMAGVAPESLMANEREVFN